MQLFQYLFKISFSVAVNETRDGLLNLRKVKLLYNGNEL